MQLHVYCGECHKELRVKFTADEINDEVNLFVLPCDHEPDEPLHICGDCGRELQIVRPGKYQCVNSECTSMLIYTGELPKWESR